MSSRLLILFLPTDTSIQVNIINQLRELLQIWNHFSQRLNTSSFGKLWSNMLVTISELEDPSISKNLVVSHLMFRLSCQRSTVQNSLILRLTFSLKDKKEKTSIIWSLFLLLIRPYKRIWADIQEKKKSQPPKVNIQFTSKDIDAFMPILFQSLLLLCLVLMLLRMHLRLYSWLSLILSKTTEMLILHGASQMSDAHTETWAQCSQQIWPKHLVMPNLKTKWLDKDHQFQLCGQPHTIKPGLTQHSDRWWRNQMKLLRIHWTKKLQPLKSWVLIFHHLAVSSIHQRTE